MQSPQESSTFEDEDAEIEDELEDDDPKGSPFRRSNSQLCKNIWTAVHKDNENYILMIEGMPGKGKSYAALKLGEALDRNFTIKNVVFSVGEFLALLNETPPKGSVIVWDESGID